MEIGWLSWPVAMDNTCDINPLLSIVPGWLALPDANSISVPISIVKSVRNQVRMCLQPHNKLVRLPQTCGYEKYWVLHKKFFFPPISGKALWSDDHVISNLMA